MKTLVSNEKYIQNGMEDSDDDDDEDFEEDGEDDGGAAYNKMKK